MTRSSSAVQQERLPPVQEEEEEEEDLLRILYERKTFPLCKEKMPFLYKKMILFL